MEAIKVKERPIIFSGLMVRAILDGRKTQTRRIVKPQPPKETGLGMVVNTYSDPDRSHALFFRGPTVESTGLGVVNCPYGKTGDHLWVRENWCVVDNNHDNNLLIYRYQADFPTYPTRYGPDDYFSYVPDEIFEKYSGTNYSSKIRSSRFMPRWASRINLEITGIRVEQLQQISESDIKAEGFNWIQYRGYTTNKIEDPDDFSDYWDHLNGKKYPWASNPWVWVIEFKKI